MKYVSKKCDIVQFRVGTAHPQLVFTTWSDLLGEERSSVKYVSKKCDIVQFRVGTAHPQLVFTTWRDLLGEERSSVKYVSKKSCSSVALSG